MPEQHPSAPSARTRTPRRRRTGALAALGAVGVVTLAGCSSTPSAAPAKKTVATSSTTTSAPPVTCPLTGTPAPGGTVPALPALAVKVDNYPAARPQSGLDKADIVFEEPVEGGITRYAAVFQCQQAALVGPIRSARNIDIGILSEFGKPLLAHVGGINPVLANINASALTNVDLGNYGSVIQHVPGRYAPYDTYASTQALWATQPSNTTPPQPVFTYSPTPPVGTAVTAVAIPFSQTSNVVWQYNATAHVFERFYGALPDTLADGVQNSATNVVVQVVHVTYGPWFENSEGGLEVQAQLYGTTGPLQVYRDGVEVTGTWSRPTLASPTQLLNAQGQVIPLSPGTTWVELVPDTIPITPTPAPAPPATTPTTAKTTAKSTATTAKG
jgi:hypothetical protein